MRLNAIICEEDSTLKLKNKAANDMRYLQNNGMITSRQLVALIITLSPSSIFQISGIIESFLIEISLLTIKQAGARPW